MMNSECMRISDVAERSHVSVDTVRYYERKRLLSGVIRDGNGHRRFPPAVVDRILVIRHAAALGFTFDELARIFERRASGKAPCAQVLDSARRKLVELDDRIAALQSLRRTLAEVIAVWEEKYQQTPPGGLAHLLESLVRREATS